MNQRRETTTSWSRPRAEIGRGPTPGSRSTRTPPEKSRSRRRMLPRRLMSTEVAEHVANWSRSKRTSRRASRKRICGDIEKPRVCQAILRAALAAPRAFHRSKNDHRWRRERWLLQWRKSCSNKAGTTLATPPFTTRPKDVGRGTTN